MVIKRLNLVNFRNYSKVNLEQAKIASNILEKNKEKAWAFPDNLIVIKEISNHRVVAQELI